MGLQPTALPCSNPLEKYNPTNFFKRKLTDISADEGDFSAPKKMCIEMDTNQRPKEEFGSEGEEEGSDRSKTPSPDPSHDSINSLSDEEDDKENLKANHEFENILAKTLLFQGEANTKVEKQPAIASAKQAINPKVIVEHQPLPSIYELQQNTSLGEDNESFDSGLSESSEGDDEEEDMEEDEDVDTEEEEEEEEEEEDDDEVPTPSPLFSSVLRPEGSKRTNPNATPSTPVLMPPKALYNDRFWQQTAPFPGPPSPMPPPPTPPAASTPPVSNGSLTNTFQFLEQSNQRIECAENGKSYLQLGTMNHSHHLPVTPIIQPKPNMVYRRPIPPFRNPLLPPVARPVCDHSNCLQKKSSHCYKNQRSRVLNLSLHKLHMARQNHEGCLRRSVLICNLLRNIEDETEKEIAQESHHFETSPPHSMEMDHYWQPQTTPQLPTASTTTASSPPATLTPSQYHLATGSSPPPMPPSSASNYGSDEFSLKDFNSSFRQTPFSSPSHPSEMETTSGSSLSMAEEEDDRGINWGSVLSLSSQSELDPLNNNSFATETWVSTLPTSTAISVISSTAVTSSTTSSSTVSITSNGDLTNGSPVPNQSSFDDIGWKLSADDVLRAFPNDENIFVGP